jgi:hypothetical protein
LGNPTAETQERSECSQIEAPTVHETTQTNRSFHLARQRFQASRNCQTIPNDEERRQKHTGGSSLPLEHHNMDDDDCLLSSNYYNKNNIPIVASSLSVSRPIFGEPICDYHQVVIPTSQQGTPRQAISVSVEGLTPTLLSMLKQSGMKQGVVNIMPRRTY